MRAQQAKPTDVLPAIQTLTDDNQILATATETGLVVMDWLKQAAQFFREASQLERECKTLLMAAKATPKPTDAASDLVVQAQAKKTNAAIKACREKWNPVTQATDALHALTVKCRQRGADAGKEAADIWNAQHFGYKREAQERAEAETRRLEAIERARAAAARQAEIDAIEAEAVQAEESGEALSSREQKFVDLFRMSSGTEAQKANHAAGLAGFRAQNSGARLIGLQKIRSAIVSADLAASLRSQAVAQRNAPIVTREVEQVQADVQKGGIDRATYTAEVFDAEALIAAIIAGAVPSDLLQINPVVANQYARSLRENLNRWPGIRAKRSERLV